MADPFSYEEVAMTPAGIGYSAHLAGVGDPYLKFPLKSRYVLLAAGQQPLHEWGELQLLTAFPIGDLYLNLESPCEPSVHAPGIERSHRVASSVDGMGRLLQLGRIVPAQNGARPR
jgi:hypothetical protein